VALYCACRRGEPPCSPSAPRSSPASPRRGRGVCRASHPHGSPLQGGARPRDGAGATAAGEVPKLGSSAGTTDLRVPSRTRKIFPPLRTPESSSPGKIHQRGLRDVCHHHWRRVSRTPRDSPILVPWASHSCRQSRSKTPHLGHHKGRKKQFPPLETCGRGRGERGGIPDALLQ